MRTPRSALGERGEGAAAEYLVAQGYEIVCRNFRRPVGEIDIVARDGDTLVFVEVRSTSTADFGTPAESIVPRKLEKVAAAATLFLQETNGDETPCRFDAVEVDFSSGRLSKVNHIQNIREFT